MKKFNFKKLFTIVCLEDCNCLSKVSGESVKNELMFLYTRYLKIQCERIIFYFNSFKINSKSRSSTFTKHFRHLILGIVIAVLCFAISDVLWSLQVHVNHHGAESHLQQELVERVGYFTRRVAISFVLSSKMV